MRSYKDSDIFVNTINKNNVVLGKVNAILTGAERDVTVLNEILYPDIKRKLIDKQKTKTMYDIGKAIEDGRIVLITLPPDKKLTDAFPFFVYKQNGLKRVCINISYVVYQKKLDTGEISYDISDNVVKLKILLISAYLALDAFHDKMMPTQNTLEGSAILWAEMFNKPLFNVVGLNNKDTYDTFMYMAIKFFLVYFIECSTERAEKIATKYIGAKNPKLLYMEGEIEARGLNMYESVAAFVHILCNDELSMNKGIRVNTMSKAMGIGNYLTNFVNMFGSSSLMALASYPYFVYVLLAANSKCKLIKDKSFDNIFKDHSKLTNRLLIGLLNE